MDPRISVADSVKMAKASGFTKHVLGYVAEDEDIQTLCNLAANNASPGYQLQVNNWMSECFGPKISGNVTERNHRFLEEALELVQSQNCSREDAHALVEYVYNRPVGNPPQEVGGVMVTLAALCNASGIDLWSQAKTELQRIWMKIPEIRAKQQSKKLGSPLPGEPIK